jgi:hypothetical protein
MWLKILSPSPNRRGIGSIIKESHYDTGPDAVSNDPPPKKTATYSSSSKVKASVKNGKTRTLKMKQESSKKLLQSRLLVPEQPKVQGNKANLQPIKTASAKSKITIGTTSNSTDANKEVLARRYWAHSSTPPPKSSHHKNPELLWNDLDPAWPNPEPTYNDTEPIHNDSGRTPKETEPTKNDTDPTLQRHTQAPCDVSCLTDDLNSVQPEAVP